MIVFRLKCADGHEFDAWFRDSAAFKRQRGRHLVNCPECGGTDVDKAIMAPRISSGTASSEVEAPAAAPSVPAPQSETPPSPAELRRALQLLRRHVETSCENVGTSFAKEARAIHDGAAKSRGIYGQATKEEADGLADDGIEFHSVPWVPTNDA